MSETQCKQSKAPGFSNEPVRKEKLKVTGYDEVLEQYGSSVLPDVTDSNPVIHDNSKSFQAAIEDPDLHKLDIALGIVPKTQEDSALDITERKQRSNPVSYQYRMIDTKGDQECLQDICEGYNFSVGSPNLERPRTQNDNGLPTSKIPGLGPRSSLCNRSNHSDGKGPYRAHQHGSSKGSEKTHRDSSSTGHEIVLYGRLKSCRSQCQSPEEAHDQSLSQERSAPQERAQIDMDEAQCQHSTVIDSLDQSGYCAYQRIFPPNNAAHIGHMHQEIYHVFQSDTVEDQKKSQTEARKSTPFPREGNAARIPRQSGAKLRQISSTRIRSKRVRQKRTAREHQTGSTQATQTSSRSRTRRRSASRTRQTETRDSRQIHCSLVRQTTTPTTNRTRFQTVHRGGAPQAIQNNVPQTIQPIFQASQNVRGGLDQPAIDGYMTMSHSIFHRYSDSSIYTRPVISLPAAAEQVHRTLAGLYQPICQGPNSLNYEGHGSADVQALCLMPHRTSLVNEGNQVRTNQPESGVFFDLIQFAERHDTNDPGNVAPSHLEIGYGFQSNLRNMPNF